MSILDLFGGNTRSEDRKAMQALTGVTDLYRGLATPQFQELTPEVLQYAGDVQTVDVAPMYAAAPEELTVESMDPRLAQVYQQGATEMRGITTDPRLRNAQMGALDALAGIVEGGGLTMADQANLARIQSQAAEADRGRREAILQNMRMSGMGGSGLELLAQLQSGQAATTDAAQQSLDVAGMAQDRALQAMMQQGQLGGQIRGQEFGEQADIAKAQDIINQFNTGNMMQGGQFNANILNEAQRFNIGNKMQAGQFNIGNKMGTEQFNVGQGNQALTGNANRAVDVQTGNINRMQDVLGRRTDTSNQAQQFNRFNIPQQQFENTMSKTQGVASGMQAQAGAYDTRAARKKQEAGEVFGGLVKLGAAGIGAAKGTPGG